MHAGPSKPNSSRVGINRSQPSPEPEQWAQNADEWKEQGACVELNKWRNFLCQCVPETLAIRAPLRSLPAKNLQEVWWCRKLETSFTSGWAFLPCFGVTIFISDILFQSLVHPSTLVYPSVTFPSQQCLFPAHLAPDVLTATTVCPASSEWQNGKSQAAFTWKRLALNSCGPLITLPASAAPCGHRIYCLSIRFSHDFDWLDWGEWKWGVGEWLKLIAT